LNKIIVIQKKGKVSGSLPNLEGDKNLELTAEQIASKFYQGFEGELISYFEVPKNTNILNFAKAIVEIPYEKKKQNHLTLYVCSDLNDNHDYMNEVALKVGYDIGWCEDGGAFYGEEKIYSFWYSSFSSIYHEILFGKVNKLIAYKEFLNEHFLFPDRSLAEQYVRLHDELSAQGENVEDYMKMIIYEIWKLKR
jgi:hypothetical protein